MLDAKLIMKNEYNEFFKLFSDSNMPLNFLSENSTEAIDKIKLQFHMNISFELGFIS